MKWAKLQSERIGSPVYGYFFDKTPAGNSYKAFHGVDLWYVFGQLEKSWRGFEKPDYDLHELMADNIASFVKTGKPQENWLPFDKGKLLMRFDENGGEMTDSKRCLAIAKYNRKHDKGPL